MTRLLVLGNACLDIGLALPRLPWLGETLVGTARGSMPGGKGLNQATVASRTGLVPVEFLAPLGNDAEAARIKSVLQAERFAALHLPRPGPATDCSVLMVMPDGENSIVTAGECAASLPADTAADAVTTLPSDGWLLMQGNLAPETTIAACVAARSRGARMMVNTAPLTWDMRPVLPFCAVAVANADEAMALTGHTGHAAADAMRLAGAAVAIVTLGAQGCIVAAEGETQTLPAPAVRMVDSTGAGDTFCGVLVACLAAGWPLDASIVAAQRAAALSVQRPGCFGALPSATELAPIVAANRLA
jgi:ribokinase